MEVKTPFVIFQLYTLKLSFNLMNCQEYAKSSKQNDGEVTIDRYVEHIEVEVEVEVEGETNGKMKTIEVEDFWAKEEENDVNFNGEVDIEKPGQSMHGKHHFT